MVPADLENAYDLNHMDATRSGLPPALLALASEQVLESGAALFQATSPASAVFFLVVGTIRLVRFGRDGEEIPIHQAYAGEFFAEASLYGDRYHCNAIAIQASTVLALPARDVRRLLEHDRRFSGYWVETLARQLRASRARVERLCLKRAHERVRHLLLTEGTGPQHRYALRGTLKELALYLGLTHEALYRTLADMQRAGDLERDADGLRLLR
jgi:CRP-like cAMP-binding protein